MAGKNGEQKKKMTAASYMFGGLFRHPRLIIFAIILTFISTLLVILPMVIVGLALDELTDFGLSVGFMNLVWLIVIFGLIYMVMYFVVGYVWAVVTLRWERDSRQEFFESLQENSMTFHDQVDSKKLLSVAMQDISWVRWSLNPALRNVVTSMLSLLITGYLLAVTDLTPGLTGIIVVFGFDIPVFTTIMLIGAPLYLLFSYRYANAVEPVRRGRSENMEQLTSLTQGVFQGIEVVRAFGAEENEKDKFTKISKAYEQSVAREGRLAAFFIPALILVGMISLAFSYGGYAVLEGVMTIGKLAEIVTLLVALEGLNFHLPRMLLMLRGGYVNSQRIVDILTWEDTMVEPSEEITDVEWAGDIVFDNVSFQYSGVNGNNDHYALRNFSVTIPGGSRVALIGGPGGGKSTLLKLLLRLYDPTEGEIRVGDVPLHAVSTKSVRDVIGLVEQDIFLFRMSINDNIAFGRSDATKDEIIQAAQRAQADEFITELPEGYESVIGERGMTLSGGQRQRLAIARALIQDPKILLLDDSVSAVDAQTEFLMRKALNEVMVERTSITVTQRLRTLIESDMVIIVDKGLLIQAGSHNDLLRTSEQYRRIFERLPGAKKLLGNIPLEGGNY